MGWLYAYRWRRSVRKALARLPNNSDGIAQALLRDGIKGRPCDPKSCPIARYLNTQGVQHVHVSPYGFFGYSTIAKVTKHVNRFIKDFDNHRYPDLIAKGELA